MRTDKRPYEVLFRFDSEGVLQGAHVQWRYVVYDDADVKVGEFLSNAASISVGKEAGFPLTEVMDKTLEAAVLSVEAKSSELQGIQDELNVLREQVVTIPLRRRP